MRKLMLFTIGFAASFVLSAYFLSETAMLVIALLCIAVAVICILLKKKTDVIRRIAVILLGGAIGAAWFGCYQYAYVMPAMEYNGKTVEAVVTATDYSRSVQSGMSTEGKIVLDGKTYNLRFYTGADTEFSPGDQIQAMFYLHCTATDEKNSDAYLLGNNIMFSANCDEITDVDTKQEKSILYLPARLRRQITDLINTTFPDDTVGFARALLLGDSSGLHYELDTDFKLSGIRHIIAVSGLHVSILFSLVYMLAGKRKVLTALLGIPALILFAAVAGFTPSIVRACAMQILMIVAMLLDKEYDPPTALSFAVLLMLAAAPSAVTSVSLQLSAGCMVGIFLFAKPMQGYLFQKMQPRKTNAFAAIIARWLSSGISVSLSATALTAPLSAVYFGTFSVFGVLTNLLTLWAVSIIFYGIIASCLLALFWCVGAQAVAWVISWLMRYVSGVAALVASVPVAAVYTCSALIVCWLIFAYILLFVFLLSRKKRPLVFTACILTTLAISIAASWILPRMDSFRASILDVGQGQSVLVQMDGKNYLVDCGGSSAENAADTAAAQLLSQGITRLDGIIVTHYDVDHAGGIPYLLTRIETEKLYLPPPDDTTLLDNTIADMAPDAVFFVTQTQNISDGDASICIYAPESSTSRNESALCVLFQREECDILITSDRSVTGERALLAQATLPEVDVLVVGHHGADDSAGLELLRAVRPRIAVISVGENNRYGHPGEKLLNRLKAFHCEIYRTDIDGTVIIRR